MKMGAFFRTCIIMSIVFTISNGHIHVHLSHIHGDHHKPSTNDDSENEKGYSSSCSMHPKPADCAEVFENGFETSGVYEIYPKNKIISCKAVRVYCDMKTDGGGWTVIQRRGNFQRSPDYFNKNWNEYKTGFGNLETEFWLGNDIIHALTNQKRNTVRFDLGVDNDTAYATYDNFWIENEELKYRLNITDYSGTAGDSMAYHHGMPFSAKDSNNIPEKAYCANLKKGGWWYDECAAASLNGLYLKGDYDKSTANTNGTYWRDWKGIKVSLTNVEIKIRPFDF